MGAPYALSSDLVSAWPAKSLEVAQYIDGQLPLIAMTQNAQTGTTYSLAATDFTKLVTLSNASPVTVTVPLESSVAWVAGTQLRLMNLGAGVVTVVGAGGVTINGSPLTLAQYKNATLTKTGTNTWTFNGSSAAAGMDLITPTSVGGTGVTVSGGAISFAAATSGSVNGCFTTAYDVYRLLFRGSVSASGGISGRLRAAGTDASGANYNDQGVYGQSVTAGAVGASGATAWPLIYDSGAADSFAQFSMDLSRPALAEQTTLIGQQGYSNSGVALASSGRHTLTTAYDGLTLFRASGTLTGTLRIYGLRN